MGTSSRIVKILKASAVLSVNAVALLFANAEEKTEERPLSEGSELFGEYNFRTEKLDAGTDPYGWYEEDMD